MLKPDSDASHTHLSELLREREGMEIGRTTLRRILVAAGLKSPRRRRPPRHRVRRQRMPREGMPIQMDGSHHRWLGDHGAPFALLLTDDDATGIVVNALFCERGEMVQVHFAVRRLGRHLIRTVLPGAPGHTGEAAYIRGDLLGGRRRTLTVMISLRTAPESRTQV